MRFMWSSYHRLLAVSASLTVLFSYLPLLYSLHAQEQIKGELLQSLQANAVFFRVKMKLSSLSAFKVRFGSRAVQGSSMFGR